MKECAGIRSAKKGGSKLQTTTATPAQRSESRVRPHGREELLHQPHGRLGRPTMKPIAGAMPALPDCAAVGFRHERVLWRVGTGNYVPPLTTSRRLPQRGRPAWHGHDAPGAQGRPSPSVAGLVSEWEPVGNHLQPPTVSCIGQHHVKVAQHDIRRHTASCFSTDRGCHNFQGPPTSAKHPACAHAARWWP